MRYNNDITLAYYDDNAEAFEAETMTTDLSDLIERFLAYLPPLGECGSILDLGCGAGRDAKAMLDRGYDVTLADGSYEMCRIASKRTGRPVRQMLFSEFADKDEYSGIWSCAALLHVSKDELPDIIKRCWDALVDSGVMYASFKLGECDGMRNGRYYSDLTRDEAVKLFSSAGGFELLDVSVTDDRVENREAPRWVNVFVRKTQDV